MSKRLLLLITFCLFLCTGFAQNWEPVGGGLYGGDTLNSNSSNALCVYNKKLYVGGAFQFAGKIEANHIAAWDGTKWQSVGNGTDDFVQALCVYDNMLCACGAFSKAGKTEASCFAYWVDTLATTTGWYPMGNGMKRPFMPAVSTYHKTLLNNITLGFVIYNGSLCSIFNLPREHSSDDYGILKWSKGENWTQICKQPLTEKDGFYGVWHSPVIGFGCGYVHAITVFNGQLCVAGGLIDKPNTSSGYVVPVAYAWDGRDMHLLGKDSMKIGSAWCYMYAFDSLLYAVGAYKTKSHFATQYGVIKWDGVNWSPVGKWEGEGTIYCMTKYHDKLYIGGRFDSICGKPANGIACWDGNSWEPVGDGFSTNYKNKKAFVYTLCVYKNELYAAGEFTASGGRPMLNIAKYSLEGSKNKPVKKK